MGADKGSPLVNNSRFIWEVVVGGVSKQRIDCLRDRGKYLAMTRVDIKGEAERCVRGENVMREEVKGRNKREGKVVDEKIIAAGGVGGTGDETGGERISATPS